MSSHSATGSEQRNELELRGAEHWALSVAIDPCHPEVDIPSLLRITKRLSGQHPHGHFIYSEKKQT